MRAFSPSRSLFRRSIFIACLLGWVGGIQITYGWTPGTGDPSAVDGFAVDTSDRTDVLAFYNTAYFASEDYASHMNWNGDVNAGVAGTTGFVFKEDVRRRINLYRALVGLPADIIFDDLNSAKSQEAALMISANNQLSHYPPQSWTHYSADGAEAAGKSNIYLGRYGPPAIDGYIFDSGDNNKPVGHRRWILYSRAQIMGTGDIPAGPSQPAANANWVIGDFKAAPTPEFIAWPNEGYSPHTLMPDRWSLSYPGASFASATVSMLRGNEAVPVTVVSREPGAGDNSIVWEPAALPSSLENDLSYTITVSGIGGSGVPDTYSYTVTLFNPSVLGDEVLISGPANPPLSGASYSFNSIDQADAYELSISQASVSAWTEGAEDVPTVRVIDKTGAAHSLRQGEVKHSGGKAFHLAFPDFSDQEFWIDREIIPSSSSQLVFYDQGRFATATTTLSAEVSQDGGLTWDELWSRGGVGLSSGLWDNNFIKRAIDLSAYDGEIIFIRFILRWNGASTVINTTADAGFFIDDISVTDAEELISTGVTELSGQASSFYLDASTAGAPLVAGADYYARIRPKVGTRWFSHGPSVILTPTSPIAPELMVNAQVYDSFNENSLVTLPVTNISDFQGANFAVWGTSADILSEVKNGALSIAKLTNQSGASENTEHIEVLSIYELDDRFFIEALVQFSNVNVDSHFSAGIYILPTDSDEFGIKFLMECKNGQLYVKRVQENYGVLGEGNQSFEKTMLLNGLSPDDHLRLLVTHDPQVSTLYFEYLVEKDQNSDSSGYRAALDYNYSSGAWQIYDADGNFAETVQGLAFPSRSGSEPGLNAVEVILEGWFNGASPANWQGGQINFLEYAAAVEYFPMSFEPADYLQLNPDVEAAFGRDYNAAWNHYLNSGVNEGRTHSASFHINDYLELNPDIAAAFSGDKGAALQHWFDWGKAEGRLGYKSWPDGFSPSDYLDYPGNEDLKAAFGNDLNAAWNHYKEWGADEGRTHSATFSINDYLELNPDIAAAYSGDKGAALQHWFDWGKAEGRLAYRSWPEGFSPSDYLDYTGNEDLKAAFGSDFNAAWNHYKEWGADEGRTHSATFSINDYLQLNADVDAAFSGDKGAALQHWFDWGKAEGRLAYRSWPDSFSPSDYLDYPGNEDVKAAFGSDFNAAWNHYKEYGVNEGRTHSASFHIDDYLTLNPDVAAAFGSDKGAALEHWFNYGINEGRSAFIPE